MALALTNLPGSVTAPDPVTSKRVRGLRVLIVEDDPDGRWALCTLMRRSGYQCDVAGNGSEAMERVASFAPQVILMDLMMPILDGLETTRRLKADPATRDIPVVALTGNVTASGLAAARAAGCDDLLTKPISFADLVRRLDRYQP